MEFKTLEQSARELCIATSDLDHEPELLRLGVIAYRAELKARKLEADVAALREFAALIRFREGVGMADVVRLPRRRVASSLQPA